MSNTLNKEENTEYFNYHEELGRQKLVEFNDYYKYFKELNIHDIKAHIDADGVNKKGTRDFNIEVKTRYIDVNQYPTILMEREKYDRMMWEYKTKGKEPLYINFLLNDDTILVFNLNKFPTPYKKQTWVQDGGHGGWKLAWRYYLPKKYAIKYKHNKENNTYEKLLN